MKFKISLNPLSSGSRLLLLLIERGHTCVDERRLCWLLPKKVWNILLLTKRLRLASLPKSWCHKLWCRLLSKLKLRCYWCELLLRSRPLGSLLHWLSKSRRNNRLECVLSRLLKCIKCYGLGRICLLLWLGECIECCLRLAKVDSLRRRRCSSVKCSRLCERRRSLLLKIKSRLTSSLLKLIILHRLLSEQVLRLIS